MSPHTSDEHALKLRHLAGLVDASLAGFLDRQREHLPGDLVEASEYALLGGGKRLRPVLCLLWCEAGGVDPARALPAAGALECMHAFSLVHDDLPALDDDDLRRGRPTLHVRTNEAMAILTGDLLQAFAYRLLTSGDVGTDVSSAWCGEMADGAIGMIGGQVLDTFPESVPDDRPALDMLRRVHAGKTGALIRAACRMGARLSGDPGFVEAAGRYGDAVGLMFQAVDDLLDVEADESTVGKRTGKDAAAGKRTYPGLLGVDGTRAEVERLLSESLSAVAGLGPAGETLGRVASDLAIRTA